MFEEMVHLIQEDTLRRLYFTVLAKPVERKQVAQPTAASHGEEEVKKAPSRRPTRRSAPTIPAPAAAARSTRSAADGSA